MLRGTIIVLALLALVVCVGLAGAQEQKEEGILGKMKGVLPGTGEKACGQKEGTGIMEKVKDLVPAGSGK